MIPWQEELRDRDAEVFFDPLCMHRGAALSDEQASRIEAVCQLATPGPLAVDDDVAGEGAVVASLPDGRLIVSRTSDVEDAEDDDVRHANAELICKARHWLLRMLMDREQWTAERETLQHRISELEADSNRSPQPR